MDRQLRPSNRPPIWIAPPAARAAIVAACAMTALWFSRPAPAAEPPSATQSALSAPIPTAAHFRDQIEALRKIAASGDAAAMRELGQRYAYARGVTGNFAQAADWLRKAADAGDAAAMADLGELYDHGDGVEPDDAAALRWYRRAADANDPSGLAAIARAYRFGYGLDKELGQSGDWLTRAAAANGFTVISRAYRLSYGIVEKDTGLAVEWFTRAADAGSAESMRALYRMYSAGDGINKDANAANRWITRYYETLRKSADAGDTRDMLVLSHRNTGSAAAAAEAVQWCRRAAEGGDIEAINQLAGWYRDGTNMAKDPAAAMAWLRLAADLGDTAGMIGIADLYAAGEGVPADPAIALSWYHKALDSGDADGAAHIAAAYETGAGVPKDAAEALRWYTKAAEGGSSMALEYFEQSLSGDPFALRQKSPQEFTLDHATLDDAILLIRDLSGKQFYVNWRALAAAGVGRRTPITITVAKDHSFADILSAMLEQAGGAGKISYRAQQRVIYISTPADVQLQTEAWRRRSELARELARSPAPPPALAILARRLPDADFDRAGAAPPSAPGVGLGDVLSFLGDVSGATIVVPWDKLASHGISKATPIALHLRDMELSRILDMVLADAGAGKWVLDYRLDAVGKKIIIVPQAGPGK